MRTSGVRRLPLRAALAIHRFAASPAAAVAVALTLCFAVDGAEAAPVVEADGSSTPEPQLAAAAEPAPRITLDVYEYYVQGNTVLDLKTIEDALSPWLGPGRSADDVDKAREALEAAYHTRGYKTVAVTIPRQVPHDGVVQLQVVESKVGRLNVTGSKYHSLEAIKAAAPSLAEGGVPQFDAVQNDLQNLNQQPDRRVTPALKAGTAPGTVDVDLVVDDSLPLHGSIELNNRRSQGTHELRSIATLAYDNLWQAGHSATLSAQVAPQQTSDAKVWFASYLARFDRSAFSLLGNFIKSDSNVSTVGGSAVIGRGTIAGLRGIYSLPASETTVQSLSFGVDYKNLENKTALAGASFETPVRYAPISLGYNATLRGDHSLVQGALSFSIAVPHFGSNAAEFDNNRYLARGQQAYWRGSASWLADTPSGFQSYLRFSGQLTDQPLLTSEQFSIGGEDSVRGYLESEALGDYGAGGSFELRSPSLGRGITVADRKLFDELRPFVFIDAARALLRNPLPEQQRRFDLASFGAGVRFGVRSLLDGSIHWARVFDSGPNTRAGATRVLFRLTGSF